MKPLNQKEWKKSESCPQEEEHQATSGLENLPIDIALDVLSRLPVRSLLRSRCVCRGWRRLIHDPRLTHFHHVRATESDPCIFFLDTPLRNQLFFVDSHDRQGYSKAVTKLNPSFMSLKRSFNLVGSCNGLLCLSSDSLYHNQLYIFNPFIGNHIELPKPTRYMNQSVVLRFGFHPVTKEYKVVRFVYYRLPCTGLNGTVEYEKSVIQIFTLGTDAWRNKGHARYKLSGVPAEALVNGALHWVTNNSTVQQSSWGIVSFDLGEEKFQEVPHPDCGIRDQCNYYLLDFGGCLSAAAYFSDGHMEIWVMKDYGVKESWTKQFIIRKYVPTGLNMFLDMLNWNCVQVLCLLKNGEILLKYKSRDLLSYNPESEEVKHISIMGLPDWFEPVIHVGSLISAEVAFGIQR